MSDGAAPPALRAARAVARGAGGAGSAGCAGGAVVRRAGNWQHPVGIAAVEHEIALRQRLAKLRGIAVIADRDLDLAAVERDEVAVRDGGNADQPVAHGDPILELAHRHAHQHGAGLGEIDHGGALPGILDLGAGAGDGGRPEIGVALAFFGGIGLLPGLGRRRQGRRKPRARHRHGVGRDIGRERRMRHQDIGPVIALRHRLQPGGVALQRRRGVDRLDIADFAIGQHPRHRPGVRRMRAPGVAPRVGILPQHRPGGAVHHRQHHQRLAE